MCQVRCYIEPSCLSFNVGPLENNDHFLCQISDSDEVLHPGDLVQRLGFTHQGTQVFESLVRWRGTDVWGHFTLS